ncbi:MAG: serine/threonine protein phosphatase [Planctomycetales bacterium]|nr:serine/threonine protein phosphatase [Planctomycetales bacterium]
MPPSSPAKPSAEKPGRTIAIGDIHGCATALAAMLEMFRPQAADTVVTLGDVIDRGPDSRGVVQQLLRLREQCRVVCILGNHEQMLLDAVEGLMPVQEWLHHGGAQALDSYGRGSGINSIDDEHVAFFRTWVDVFETPGEFFVHGNYWATRPLDRQPWRDLRWQSLHWHTPEPHRSGKTAVLGHTSNKQGRIVNLGHLVCIDTYCCGGGWLTALEPATGRVWQTQETGEGREGSLPAPTGRF